MRSILRSGPLLGLMVLSCGGGDETPTSTPTSTPSPRQKPTSDTALTRQITDPAELIGGPRAHGQVGDWILENDQIRVIIQDIKRGVLFNIYGGNFIDADVVRTDGSPGTDLLGEIFTAINLHTLIDGRQMTVITSGLPGAEARLRLSGGTTSLPVLPPKEAVPNHPLNIQQDYILAPGARHVEVRTTVTNPGDNTLGFQGADILLFGSSLISSARGKSYGEVAGRVDYLTSEGEGAAYGWMDPNGQLIVPIEDAGQTGAMTAFERLAPGESKTFTRYLVVGRDASDVTNSLFELQSLPTSAVTGQVRDTSGNPIAGAHVEFRDEAGGYVTRATSGSDGGLDLRLIRGTFSAYVTAEGRAPRTLEGIVVNSGQSAVVDAEVGDKGQVSLRCEESAGKTIPCRAVFNGADGRQYVFSETGTRTFPMTPGTYSVTLSRGMEFDLKTINFTVAEGGVTPLNVTLARALDTSGWISMDSHLHSKNSNDAGTPLTEKVRELVGEGVEVAVATDHDWVTDYSPAVAELGLQNVIHTVIGNESSIIDYGHFNFYPVTIDPQDPMAGNGSQFWFDADMNPMNASELFATMRQDPGDEVIQINHPRSGGKGYLDMIGYNTNTGRALREPLATDFDAIEVQTEVFGDDAILLDFFSLLNGGLTPSAVGTSDAHEASDQNGMPRTYVQVSDDNPAKVTDDMIVSGVHHQQVIVSSGIFPRIVAFAGEGAAGPGQMLAWSGGVTFNINLTAPTWARMDHFILYANGVPLTLAPTSGGYTQSSSGSSTQNLTPTVSGVRQTSSFTVTTTPTVDTYYVLVAWGDQGQPLSGHTPIGLTNPIYIDVDGGGFEAPGAGSPIGPAPRWPGQSRRDRTCDHD